MKKLSAMTDNDRRELFRYFNAVMETGKNLLLRGEMLDVFRNMAAAFPEQHRKEIERLVNEFQEAVVVQQTIFVEARERIALSQYFRFNLDDMTVEEVTIVEYLAATEHCAFPGIRDSLFTINFKPFYDRFPSVRDPKSIGAGMEYLNRYLSSEMFTKAEKWRKLFLNFLALHKYGSNQLLINERITDIDKLFDSIDKALTHLSSLPDEEPFASFKLDLQSIGFEQGLGSTAASVADNLRLLRSLVESPDHNSLKQFISRIPMIFNIVVVSPHGYFAQEGVLGLPDTGGQVVYILDQVKALEKEMIQSFKDAGLDVNPKILILTRLIPEAGNTTCNQRLEKVHETNNVWILRVPFRTHNPEVTNRWISRFEIYPYLEEFAEDSSVEILSQLVRRPDLVIGNYTDGNIVATVLARRFGVTQCTIAHALEKSKYLYSALYWKSLDDHYHFSLQFTGDLIAMNSADFVITSSYQEIAGTQASIGQYESYKAFTMPELYRVENGINLFHPKFNVVSPGVNEKVYFPYTKTEQRFPEIMKKMEEMVFGAATDPEIRGALKNPERTPIFTMARLDKIKNITALVRWFGESPELRERANLVLVAGLTDPNRSSDIEEQEQIHLMHQLMDQYQLDDHVRWIGKLFRKTEAGEIYRVIADHRGVFVQPGLFEGFGLTVLEAMITGLPVFATQYGGPSEIVENNRSGFHIDPVNAAESTQKILTFINATQKDPKQWEKISKQAIARVNARYNWKLYSESLLTLAKIYGFWRFSTNLPTSELFTYLDSLYYLLYKPMARRLMEKHGV
ncbi:MAG: sucrose synthase [Bacteroidota bacterium]